MKKLMLIVTIVAFVACQTAYALDLQPPWWRGKWSTTSQVWEFPQNIHPGDLVRPDGPAHGGQPPLPSTELVWYPGLPPAPQEYMDVYVPGVYQGHDIGYGVIPLSGIIEVIVDNHDPKPENEKWIYIQLTWAPQHPGEFPIIHVEDPLNVGPFKLDPFEEVQLTNEWTLSKYEIHLPHNPEWEFVKIEGTINVDELVIDTWCIPEPGGMALIGICLLALMRKR